MDNQSILSSDHPQPVDLFFIQYDGFSGSICSSVAWQELQVSEEIFFSLFSRYHFGCSSETEKQSLRVDSNQGQNETLFYSQFEIISKPGFTGHKKWRRNVPSNGAISEISFELVLPAMPRIGLDNIEGLRTTVFWEGYFVSNFFATLCSIFKEYITFSFRRIMPGNILRVLVEITHYYYSDLRFLFINEELVN